MRGEIFVVPLQQRGLVVFDEIDFAADIERAKAEIMPLILTAKGDHNAVTTIKRNRIEANSL